MKWPFSQKKNKSPGTVPAFCWLWQCYAEAGKELWGNMSWHLLSLTEPEPCYQVTWNILFNSQTTWGDLFYIRLHFLIEGIELLSNFLNAAHLVGARQPEFEPASCSCTAWAGNDCISSQKEFWSVRLPCRAMGYDNVFCSFVSLAFPAAKWK